MKTYNQADLFVIELVSMTKLEGDLSGDLVVLCLRNLAIEPRVFDDAVSRAFVDGEMEKQIVQTKVVLAFNAEHLYDREHDVLDMDLFLAEMAERVIDKLNDTRGWDSADSADKRQLYDLLD